jgi:prevent-host-death family protein
MATIGVRELKAKASDVLDRAEAGEPFLVTRRGRPVAVVLPFNIETEDIILAQAPAFIKLREDARSEYRKGRTEAWEDVKAATGEIQEPECPRGSSSPARQLVPFGASPPHSVGGCRLRSMPSPKTRGRAPSS